MNRRVIRRRVRRLELDQVETAAPPPGPKRLVIPYPDGESPPIEREPVNLPPSTRRIVIPDWDDRYPPGWFE
jgi:hypothetical protein